MFSYFHKKKSEQVQQQQPIQPVRRQKQQMTQEQYQKIIKKFLEDNKFGNWQQNRCFKNCLDLDEIVLDNKEESCLTNCCEKMKRIQQKYQELKAEY